MTPEGAAAAAATAAIEAVEEVLADHPEVEGRRVGPQRWVAVLPGEIRQAIPVGIEVGQRTCTLSCFLMRGPRGGAAALHEVLLRKNLGTSRVHFCLDGDGDVVLVARLPLAAVAVDELEAVLGEMLGISEQSFEALVHLGYPGVFPPLRRAGAPLPAAEFGPDPV